ncbi:phosphatase PAP2 family protein [Aliiroseovarius crassostreae]|uniref:phosphatase PAP2 family protein n=1 Tax=Aliiroseovarius crassostreae TaxID=154981 RepID=UPI00220161FB|nr:phosphatase PAP2 family protein [Aliiroseovarius crassostreae]UWP88503.1 phosphatase PAP2 family protein [Aliiroseovarius crassostreae]
MPLFALITLAYLIVGGLVTLIYRDNPLHLLLEMAEAIPFSLLVFLSLGWWVVPLFLVVTFLFDRKTMVTRLSRAILAVMICSAMFLMFTMLKTTMPFILPFWADPWMADLDRALHFGVDPWRLTHAVSAWINPELAGTIYFTAWLLPCMYLPVLIVMFDMDARRFRRFILLYLFSWIVMGNVLALAFLSAGPIFYDRLLGGDTFVPMMASLQEIGFAGGFLDALSDNLWAAYESKAQLPGSGISAFPSVHIATATVFALYLYERHRAFLPLSILIVATYQFLSVYQGWHYAIDGYFSILVMIGVWIWLRRREERSAPRPSPATDLPQTPAGSFSD